MKFLKKVSAISLKVAVAMGTMLLAGVTRAKADGVSMQIIADNDFALFGGDNAGVTRLIYQNDVSWSSQLENLLTFSFNMKPGETTLYLLGLGGGGTENISGTINGIDLTTIPVQMSSDIGPYLTNYESEASTGGTVDQGTYTASLADVQNAFSQLTWGAPTPTNPEIDDVAAQSPTGKGFHFDSSTAHLFQFSASDLSVPTETPEPSTFLLFVAGGAALAVSRYRRSSSRCA